MGIGLTKIDRYIIAKFLSSFLFSLFLFALVSMVIDTVEKVDNFIKYDVPLKNIVFNYYFNFIPYILILLTPIFVFISVIFFTSKLAIHSEIIAIYSAGVSVKRLLLPYFISSFLIGIMLMAANHFIIPKTNRGWHDFELTYYTKKSLARINKTFQIQIGEGQFLFIENYTQLDNVGYKFSYEILQNHQLQYKIKADRIAWIPESEKWRLTNFLMRKFDEKGEQIKFTQVLDTVLGFSPSDLDIRVNIKEEMQTPELKKYIDKLKINGEKNLAFYEIEYYRRTADVFMMLILTVIGFSIASKKVRGGMGLHIVFGFALSAIYIFLSRFSTTFSTNSDLSPIIGVWFPNIVFLFLALILIKKNQF